jgi:hypothetical protein
MPYTTTTANQRRTNYGTIPIINCATTLQKYMEEEHQLVERIRREFHSDLAKPACVVEDPSSLFPANISSDLQYKARICRLNHETMIHNMTLCSPSELILAEQNVNNSFKQLERLRKRLVNNKQQRTTTIKQIREMIRKSSTAAATTEAALQNELEDQPAFSSDLKRLIETVRQNHMTIANKILEEIPFHVSVLKQFVLGYQNTTRSIIEKIMYNAKKCQTFIAKCRQLAMIEFCAASWWFATQKDPMDHDEYNVVAVDDNCSTFHSTTVPSSIRIIVYGRHTLENPNPPIVNEYVLDSELAEEILTQEAVKSCEDHCSNMARGGED